MAERIISSDYGSNSLFLLKLQQLQLDDSPIQIFAKITQAVCS